MMSKYVKRFECDLLARGAMVSVGGRCNLLIERLMLDSTLVHNPHLTQTIPALLETSQLLCRFSQTNKIWQESYRLIGICLLPHLLQTYLEILPPRKKKLLEVMILPKETCFIASILGEESVID